MPTRDLESTDPDESRTRQGQVYRWPSGATEVVYHVDDDGNVFTFVVYDNHSQFVDALDRYTRSSYIDPTVAAMPSPERMMDAIDLVGEITRQAPAETETETATETETDSDTTS